MAFSTGRDPRVSTSILRGVNAVQHRELSNSAQFLQLVKAGLELDACCWTDP